MTIHLFISQALVSASIYTRVKAGGPIESQRIPYSALFEEVSFLSQLFRGEFIFRSEGLATNLHETVLGLESDGVIKINRKSGSSDTSSQDVSSIESIELSDAERENGRENFDFYCFLIWPFIEVAWLGAVSLLMLTPPADHTPSAAGQPAWVDAKAFLSNAQLLGKTMYAQGDLSYFEAVNKETLKNAHTRCEEEGIIIVKKPPKGNRTGAVQMVRLADDWLPKRGASGKLKPEGRLWDFCEEISRSRLEGKNRRDGDAVVGRTFRLVEAVSKEIWADSAIDVGKDAEPVLEGPALSPEKKQARKDKRKRAPLRRAHL